MQFSKIHHSDDFVFLNTIYKKIGRFDYRGKEYTNDLHLLVRVNIKLRLIIYIGELRAGSTIKEGVGICVYQNRGIYEGSWKNGRQHGFGRIIYPSGIYYIGSFKDGKCHGKGKICYNDGRVFKGECENGIKNGYGIMTYPNGKKKKGKWNNLDVLG